MIDQTKRCPCQTGQAYLACCGQFIADGLVAETAVQLMRSRYTAYVLGERGYLAATWHPDYRPAQLTLDPRIRWVGLEVIDTADTGQDRAEVEFEARLLADSRVDALHERSRFVRQHDAWLYTDGEALPASFQPWKVGRNADCPCASGKKFKRCCGSG